jgi:uncharacterized Zn-binding protein involved in type VI secretion
MTNGYFIRLGDRTDCGGEVVEADDRVNMFGVAHAREGDGVTCGKDGKLYAIQGGVSHIISHGRLVAGTLDSFSSCPCGARLIASEFTASYTNDDNSNSRTFNRSAQTHGGSDRSATTTAQPTNIKRANSSPPPLRSASTNPAGCNHPDQMEGLASYIAEEMNRNISHPTVMKMKELNSFDALAEHTRHQKLPWYARLLQPNFQATELANMGAVMALWAERVGQNRPWDHKPKIQGAIGGIWHKQGGYDYFYDIWSNIHYGYVGMAGGLSESALLDGAGVEQIASDSIRKIQKWEERPGPHRSADIEGMRAWDDAPDRVSIMIGMNLYKEYPSGGLTAKIIMDKVLAVPVAEWAKGIQEHDCK